MSDSVTSNTKSDDPNIKSTQTLINNDSENLIIYGYSSNILKCWLTYMLYFLTIGLLRLLFHWFPHWKLYATYSRCSLSTATKILIVDNYRNKYETYFVEDVQILEARNNSEGSLPLLTAYLETGTVKESLQLRVVACKKLFYVWIEENEGFVKLSGIDKGRKCSDFFEYKGYTASQQSIRQITYGKNKIEVASDTILGLLIMEALTPFYVFQVFSLGVWFAEKYYYYTIAIVIMSVFGISSSILQTRRNQQNLQKSVDSSTEVVQVCRGSEEYENVLSSDLVPGDVISLPENGCVMQCDAVLLSGTCIVNESMLTGESVPITKTGLSRTSSIYNIKEDSFHTLFSGTKVIETQSSGSDKLLAVVVRTGYLTTKGELVRSILYPPPSDFKFDRDSYKYIGILSVVAILGCIYTILLKSHRSIAAGDIAVKTLTLFTDVIPPALPAAMTVGKLYALSRLKKCKIFCINSRVINVSGSIDYVCFDKTGTLTEDSLDMWGVVPNNRSCLDTAVNDVNNLESNSIITGMATCHNLAIVKERLLGDPLDIKVFESTGWILENRNFVNPKLKQNNTHGNVEICCRFQFSSTLQRMSVIIKKSTFPEYYVYCKGSPEMVASLSNPETIPHNLQAKLKEYTSRGFRVIALAGKKLIEGADLNKIERADVESNLNFLALIVLENCLKPETSEVINELRRANIKTTMITGDNIQTAVSVAKQCGILSSTENVVHAEVLNLNEKFCMSYILNDSSNAIVKNSQTISNLENGFSLPFKLVINGANWALLIKHLPDEVSELVKRGAVFARMSGNQKQQLIEELQKLGFYVAMCGDGANDCGALKAAHVGISLSEAESSVASPFTSKTPNISCVPKVIKEGRAALATSTGVFKFMVCYSLTQFASTIILYGIDSNLTALQYLYIDICLALNFMMVFGKTKAYEGPLHKRRPLTSLLSVIPVLSILLQMFLVIVFETVGYKLIQNFEWYEPFYFDPDNENNYSCYENYTIFCLSLLQYITLAVCFSKGKPFRMPVYTNKPYLAGLFIMTVLSVYITIYPAGWVINLFELKVPPKVFAGFCILGLGLANFILSLLVEDVLIEYMLNIKLLSKLQKCFTTCKKNKGNTPLVLDSIRKPSCLESITFENDNN